MVKFFDTLLIFSFLFIPITPANAEEEIVFKTVYTSIYYAQEDELETFLWRITEEDGIDAYSYPGLASARVDRIVEKVESILDMYPQGFHVKIYVKPAHQGGPISYYTHGKNAITLYLDNVTENILAHEVAHAVICAYFKVLPPAKIREILSQYVDQHLGQ